MEINTGHLVLAGLASLVGLILGVERELKSKPAGLRTLMLVSMGSCVFMILSKEIGTDSADRIASNIVTGIGFLGAGAIFRDDNKINGITTAAMIWVAAALGMCVGNGHIAFAFITAVSIVALMWLLFPIENFLSDRQTVTEYTIAVENDAYHKIDKVENSIERLGLQSHRIGLQKKEGMLIVKWGVKAPSANHKKLKEILMKDEDILELEC